MKRRLLRMLLTLAIGYVCFVAVVSIFQRRLIYFPTRLSANVAQQFAANKGFIPWRNDAGDIIGWKLPATEAAVGSVLIAHGNAGCSLDRDYFAQPIHEALQLDVYVLEYPGYGAREGSPGLNSWMAAGEGALRALPGGLPVYLVSESIGAGVVAHLAGAFPERIRGMAMFVAYDDLAAVGQSAMPILPVRLVLRDRFRPARSLENYRGPVKVVLAGADEVIPVRFGQRLFDQYRGPKQLEIIPNARHNDVAEQSSEWWRETFAFWQRGNAVSINP